MKTGLCLVLVAGALCATGCGTTESGSAPAAQPPSASNLPRAGETLTDFSSCKVEASGIPAAMKAGSEALTVKVTVTNSSKVTWPADTAETSNIHAIAIGYHFNEGKDPKANWIEEGNHFLLRRSLEPGGSETLDVKISPPAKTGSFVLFIEPVQEGVAWFGKRDGCVYSTPIVVN